MNRTIHTALFDLDGTLINTNDHILHAFNYAFQKVLGQTIDVSLATSTFGIPLREAMAILNPSSAEALYEAYQEYSNQKGFKDIQTFPHAKETLSALKEQGYYIGIVTSRRKKVAQDFLDIFQLMPYIDCVIGPEDCMEKKPNPEPVLRALDTLNTAPTHAVMIGDSVHDIVAGKTAGTKTIGVTYAAQGIASMRSAGCDKFIEHLSEIPTLLENWQL